MNKITKYLIAVWHPDDNPESDDPMKVLSLNIEVGPVTPVRRKIRQAVDDFARGAGYPGCDLPHEVYKRVH